MPRPQRLSRDIAYDGRLVRLRVDRIRLPSGRETTREVIEHPGAVVILPVTASGEIWFVRQFRYAIDAELLELPAGLIDPGETPQAAARRELGEEVGLEPGSLELIATLNPSAGYSNETVTLYVAGDCREIERPNLDEGLTIVRLTPADVLAMARQPVLPLRNAATAVAVLWYANQRTKAP